MIRPIVRLLLHFRISMNAVVGVIKKVYLEESKKKIEQDGRKPTVPELAFEAGCSDISLVSDFLKGHRKSVSQIVNLGDSEQSTENPTPPLSLEAAVLERWQSDPAYLDDKNLPVALPVRGRKGLSFDALVRRCVSGKMSYGPVLKNLKDSGVITHDTSADTVKINRIRKKTARDAVFGRGLTFSRPDSLLDATIEGAPIKLLNAHDRDPQVLFSTFCRSLSHHASTIADNYEVSIDTDASSRPYTRMQVEYYSTLVPKKRFWEFQSFTLEKMIDAIGEWATETEQKFEESPPVDAIPAGFGIYLWDLRKNIFDTESIGTPEIRR
ncbi:MAG: DUF6502 family protein [Xanthomonadales bacterium]|nr:DUF6502 family protein [Xanthomonadales bacterium]